MKKKSAVLCHNGLGDGIISLVLANNFHLNGWDVDTFHNGLELLKSWFPYLTSYPYPSLDKIPSILAKYDQIVVFHNDTFEFVLKLIKLGKKTVPEKIKVIYAYPSKGIIKEPFYSDCLIDPTIPIVQNLENFCGKILNFSKTTKANGFIPPKGVKLKRYPNRVCLHTVSSRDGKNWPRHKYVKLALHLRNKGFDPSFIVGGPKDRGDWEKYLKFFSFELPYFETLDEVARHICESGFLIGNDSGFGHLASCLGIPTVTISRRKTVAQFWRPGWAPGKIVNPPSFVPNIRGFRLRDRKWKHFVSCGKVLRAFDKLLIQKIV